jgi:uncharacterized RmlC-like cupin family protein
MNKDNVIQTEYGYDIIWADTEYYCSKILVFEKANQKTSLHFHKTKNKSWFVNAGKFSVTWIDTVDGKSYAKELPEGSTFHVPALMPVLLESLANNSAMAETANNNVLDDIYRLN